jgi:hypothetical protein
VFRSPPREHPTDESRRYDLPVPQGRAPSVGEIEYYTTWACKTERALLNPASAGRIHCRPESHELVQFVRKIAPHEVGLLNIDFPWITAKSRLYGMALRPMGSKR